ncbi:pectinesterase inhibitor-like [Senna tora]|uniref:Pectinesterase inhibitor-like n=1 Tax=Senna tora TaxID=362788 RepID=A0A834WKI0_9FABA|nr:pectinesterase inhibitor-like [Senna tora]
MGSNSNHLLILFFFIFSHNLIALVKSEDSLIDKLCSKTQEPVLCKDCLRADPTSNSTDERGLALIAIGCAEKDTTLFHDDTFSLLQNATGKLKEILNDCAQNSFLAKEDFPPVARYVREGDYNTAKDVIAHEIIPFVIDCLKTFDKTPELPVPQRVLAGTVASNQTCTNAVQILSSVTSTRPHLSTASLMDPLNISILAFRRITVEPVNTMVPVSSPMRHSETRVWRTFWEAERALCTTVLESRTLTVRVWPEVPGLSWSTLIKTGFLSAGLALPCSCCGSGLVAVVVAIVRKTKDRKKTLTLTLSPKS